MLSIAMAISGMLAAEAAARAGTPPAAVEISFVTHAGEGAAGRKRFTRDGCYQTESGGSTGGSGYARDSQAGCLLPADVATVFARLGTVAEGALIREKAASPKGGAAGGARAEGLLPGGAETKVVLIRGDGSRWVAANKPTADDILRAVNELPSENQWYAEPPDKPVGPGAQLVVVSYTSGSSRTEASLTADGRWWCNQSVVGAREGDHKLPAKPPKPLQETEAAARLARILKGMRPDTADDATAARDKSSGDSETAEVAWPGQPRAPLRPRRSITNVISRFASEMQSMAAPCPHRPIE